MVVLDEEAALLDLRVRDHLVHRLNGRRGHSRLLEALETRRHRRLLHGPGLDALEDLLPVSIATERVVKRGSAAWASPPMRRAMAFHVSAI